MAPEAATAAAAAVEDPKAGDVKPPAPAPGDKPAAGAGGEGDKKPAEKPEEKPAAQQATPEKKAAAEAAAAKGGSPAKFELKLPAGSESWLGDADVKNAEAFARAQGWSNEQAQAFLERTAEQAVAQSEAFRVVTEADPDYGGEHLVETQRLAQLAIDKLRPESHPHAAAFKTMLARSGMGNHVEVLSFLADAGRHMAEDAPTHTRAGSGPKADATSIYDHPTSKALENAK
jgi:hypothetical protein